MTAFGSMSHHFEIVTRAWQCLPRQFSGAHKHVNTKSQTSRTTSEIALDKINTLYLRLRGRSCWVAEVGAKSHHLVPASNNFFLTGNYCIVNGVGY